MATIVRYAQCWEDADVLTSALAVEPGHTCLAIASAGDNALALLANSPRSVTAIDINPAQLACLELRVAAYRVLDEEQLRRFCGARPATDRHVLYQACRPHMTDYARTFWDSRPQAISAGFFSAGKFEQYLALFRNRLLPLIHSSATIESALTPKSYAERARFYDEVWSTSRWRGLFRFFFSRDVMGVLGRDGRFFEYAEGNLVDHLERRVRHAFVDLDPASNPYLHWMLTGAFGEAMPFSLRSENISAIRANLHRLSWKTCSLEEYLQRDGAVIDRFALSDVFEYVSPAQYASLLQAIVARGAPHARLTYWNMVVPRTRPQALGAVLCPDERRANVLHLADKTFFYSRVVIENLC